MTADRELHIALAELRVELRETRHDVKGLMAGLNSLATKDETRAVAARVDKIEGHIAKVVFGLLASFGGIGASFLGIPRH